MIENDVEKHHIEKEQMSNYSIDCNIVFSLQVPSWLDKVYSDLSDLYITTYKVYIYVYKH